MIVGSLFSGIGGIDLGLERAGFHVAWQCEADEYRRSVLKERFDTPCTTDVRMVGRGVERSRLPRRESSAPRAASGSACADPAPVDLLCGGFPCQDLSVAGRRAGLNGTRSSLFFEFARIADLVLPTGGWILIENVPGLLSSNGGRDYAVVLATLAELGFHDLAWRVLDSRHFGVPQRRRRVYILARRARGQRACQVLLEPQSSAGHPQTRREAGQDVAVASLSGLGSGGPDDNDGQPGRIVTARTHDRALSRAAEEARRTLRIVRRSKVGSPPPRRELAEQLAGELAAALSELPHQDAPQHGVRRLTPREAERLQGFPDDWTLIPGASDSKRYAALGDAVTVPVAEWIGRRMMEVAA